MEKISITVTTKKEFENELEHLLKIERPKVIQEISEARKQGDLSENAEFDAARERQAHIESRITEIQNLLENHILIAEGSTGRAVSLGSRVNIFNSLTNKEESYEIIGSIGVDPFSKPMKISNDSPIGRALMGKVAGNEAEVTEVNKPYKIKIIKIY